LIAESTLETDCRLNKGEASSLPSLLRNCVSQAICIIHNVRQLIIQGFSWQIFKVASSVSDTSSLIFLLFERHTFKTISSFDGIYQRLYRKMASGMKAVKFSFNLKTYSFSRKTPLCGDN